MNSKKNLIAAGQCLVIAAGTVWLAMPSPLQAQEATNACRPLDKSDTVVIIGANDQQRVDTINQVVQAQRLQGEFCQNKLGRTVWMSQKLESKDTAMQIFRHFKAAGLIKPVQIRSQR